MFEDSTFESAGRIRTRSRRWMIAAFTFNASILLALILIPLICPEALPASVHVHADHRAAGAAASLKHAQSQSAQTPRPQSQMDNGHIFAPRTIPHDIYIATHP